jgi:hypothetical protein
LSTFATAGFRFCFIDQIVRSRDFSIAGPLLRQSPQAQVQINLESQRRQYGVIVLFVQNLAVTSRRAARSKALRSGGFLALTNAQAFDA